MERIRPGTYEYTFKNAPRLLSIKKNSMTFKFAAPGGARTCKVDWTFVVPVYILVRVTTKIENIRLVYQHRR
jgi:hypothetical protein